MIRWRPCLCRGSNGLAELRDRRPSTLKISKRGEEVAAVLADRVDVEQDLFKKVCKRRSWDDGRRSRSERSRESLAASKIREMPQSAGPLQDQFGKLVSRFRRDKDRHNTLARHPRAHRPGGARWLDGHRPGLRDCRMARPDGASSPRSHPPGQDGTPQDQT